MLVGPVFTREMVTIPRRPKLYVYRSVYAACLLALIFTAWLILEGTQEIRNVGDMARFGAILFQILAPLQLTLIVFFSSLAAAGAVAQEKDRRTLIPLLMTQLSNSELVLGKLMASVEGSDKAVSGLAMSSDGKLAATWGSEGTIKLWSIE